MANITFALLQSNGGRVAQVLSAMVTEKLYDSVDLRSVMTNVPFQALGSNQMDVTQNAVPLAFQAASSETSGGLSESAFSTGKFSLAPARYSIQYQASDLFGITGGALDLDNVVSRIVNGVSLTMTALLCDLFPSLANDVGPGSGVDLDVDSIFDAMYQLNSESVPGPYTCVLHQVQMNDLKASLRGEVGPAQFQPATAEMLSQKGIGYQGSWMGVDFYQSNSVDTVAAGADRSGAMFGQGCFAYTLANVSVLSGGHIPDSNILVNTPELIVETERDSGNALTTLHGHCYPSVVEAEDLRGVEIISDA